MYYRTIETDTQKKQAHDAGLKADASTRLKLNAERRKAQKKQAA